MGCRDDRTRKEQTICCRELDFSLINTLRTGKLPDFSVTKCVTFSFMYQYESGVKYLMWSFSFVYPVIRKVKRVSYRRRVEMHAARKPVLGGIIYSFWQFTCTCKFFVVFHFALFYSVLVVQETLECHVRLVHKFLVLLGVLLESNKSLKLHGSFFIWLRLVSIIFRTAATIYTGVAVERSTGPNRSNCEFRVLLRSFAATEWKRAKTSPRTWARTDRADSPWPPPVPHPPYSPDLAPYGFLLFPKMKLNLKLRWIDTIEEIHAELQRVLDALAENYFRKAFQKWRRRWNWKYLNTLSS
jgi:hypothetical protein